MSGCSVPPKACDAAIEARDPGRLQTEFPSAQGSLSDAAPAEPFKPIPTSLPERTPAKLLPTPVSDQVAAPPASVGPEVLPDITDGLPEGSKSPPAPDAESEPSADKATLPDPPQQPLPDILVDPFIEDVGERKLRSLNDIALAAAQEQVSKESVGLPEPKRLNLRQQGVLARPFETPRGTRIVLKRVFDEKLVP